jgi:hypothetical protein
MKPDGGGTACAQSHWPVLRVSLLTRTFAVTCAMRRTTFWVRSCPVCVALIHTTFDARGCWVDSPLYLVDSFGRICSRHKHAHCCGAAVLNIITIDLHTWRALSHRMRRSVYIV